MSIHSKRRAYLAILLCVLGIVFWVGWRAVQPTYGTFVDFEWNQLTGFTRASINRPPLSIWGRLLVTPFDQLVLIQARPYIASEIRKVGWQKASGRLAMSTLGPLPVIVGVDHLSLRASGSTFILDPEETPLMRAAGAGDLAQVRTLLADLVDVNARDQSGYTALMYASKSRLDRADIAKTLLSAGADPNARDKGGNTPLTWATWNGLRLGVMKELIAAGADINVRDAWGNPVLLDAASAIGDEGTSLEAVKLLLEAGVDVSQTNSNGETALDLAGQMGRHRIVELLKRKSDT